MPPLDKTMMARTPRLVPKVHFLSKISPMARTNYLVKMPCLINQGHSGARSASLDTLILTKHLAETAIT